MLPGNLKALELWNRIQTQWRTGYDGPTGLDYNALYRVARTIGTRIDRAMLDKIQALEFDLLNELAERRQREAERNRQN